MQKGTLLNSFTFTYLAYKKYSTFLIRICVVNLQCVLKCDISRSEDISDLMVEPLYLHCRFARLFAAPPLLSINLIYKSFKIYKIINRNIQNMKFTEFPSLEKKAKYAHTGRTNTCRTSIIRGRIITRPSYNKAILLVPAL